MENKKGSEVMLLGENNLNEYCFSLRSKEHSKSNVKISDK